MSKCNVVTILNTLTDKKYFSSDKDARENVEEWASVVIQRQKDYFHKNDCVEPTNPMFEESEDDLRDNVEQVKLFLKNNRIPKFKCRFNIQKVRSRLEKLMGTNYVSLTDREYMQKLQERILEDYEEQMDKRIKVREEEEMERVKNLVLVGKIPLDQAPPEMARHPIMLIENYCNKMIAERRAKIKIYKVKIPTYLYWDDTPDPPSGLSIESGHVFRHQGDRLCHPVDLHLGVSEEDDIEAGYMMTTDEYDTIKYEDSLVKKLMACETVDEMYAMADDIIGVLKTIDDTTRVPEDNISETLNAA